mgnify:CR=1 FL=1
MARHILIKLLVPILLTSITQDQEVKMIEWNESFNLEWSDYKANPDWDDTNVAISATSLSFKYGLIKNNSGEVVGFQTEVKSYFYPQKSWYKKTSDVPLDLLIEHERLRFDITELFARYFRRSISKLKPSKRIVNQFLKLNDSISNAMNRKHQLYDFETNGGLTREFQKQWEQEINEQLNSLAEFSIN